MLTIEGFHLWALSLVKTKKEEMPTKNEVERIQNWESGALRNLCVCMCFCVCVCVCVCVAVTRCQNYVTSNSFQ